MTRHREQDLRTQMIGTHVSPIGPTTFFSSALRGFWRTCDDTIGEYPFATDFSLMESYESIPTLNGQIGGHIWTECPVAYRPGVPDPRQQWPVLTLLDRNNVAWKILSETNPSAPHVSVPTFVAEMKDLPSLFKGWGDSILKRVANGLLSWRWAIRPLIGDLRKVFNFVKAVDDRVRMLMKLRAGETLRKRVHLGTELVYGPISANQFVESSGTTIRADFQVVYAKKAWGSAQWKLLPDTVLPMLGYGPLQQLANNLTFGLTYHEFLATAWEVTPWSWLVDWFSNVGDVIAATNNSVGCTWQNVCYMRTLEAIRTCKFRTDTSGALGLAMLHNQNYYLKMLRKERYVVFPVLPLPIPQLPLLTMGQWSILAALAVQRL